MGKFSKFIGVLLLTGGMFIALSKPSAAEVIINNFLSPFTTIQVGPGVPVYRPYGHHYCYYGNCRCYRRWDAYRGEWNSTCVRMRYYEGPSYSPYGPYGDRPYWDNY